MEEIKQNKCCSFCGRGGRVHLTPLGLLCQKHAGQYYKHGRLSKRTIKDKNEVIINGNIAKIITTDIKGNPKDEIIIDIDDLSLIQNYRWNSIKNGTTSYAHHTCYKDGKPIRLILHRLIMGLNKEDKYDVDHINGNGLDNRKCNLRIATRSQNNLNHQKAPRGRCGMHGIDFHKREGKYRARITVNRKVLYLGQYSTLEEAAKVRREAELKCFGEFAPNHNKDDINN